MRSVVMVDPFDAVHCGSGSYQKTCLLPGPASHTPSRNRLVLQWSATGCVVGSGRPLRGSTVPPAPCRQGTTWSGYVPELPTRRSTSFGAT